jgi:hypothetical protein
MFQPRQDQESAFIEMNCASDLSPGAPSIYHRLLGHAISMLLLVALAVVEIWYLLTSTHHI